MNNITKRIICLLLCVLCIGSFAVNAAPIGEDVNAAGSTITTGNVVSEGFETAISNDKYELLYNESTDEVALREKKTNIIWYSNPQNREDTESATTQNYKNLSSQIIVNYFDSLETKTVDSFSQSTAVNQTVHKIENDTLIVEYNFGVEEFTVDMLPAVILKDTMEKEFLSKLTEDEIDTVTRKYVLYEKDDCDETMYDVMVTNYPIFAKKDIYVLTSCTKPIGRKIYELFVEKCDYSVDNLEQYCNMAQIENKYIPPVTFKFVLEYSLSDDGFSVQLDTAKTEYDKDFPPVEVNILPFFGATMGNDGGYMFVPDGSGAIINFNNEKTDTERYRQLLFGTDGSKRVLTDSDEDLTAVIPVFAMADKSGKSFYASIDEGYECGGITADIAGSDYAFNNISSFYQIIPYDKVSISDKNTEDDTTIMYPSTVFDGNVVISYHMFDKYVEYDTIACEYRDMLIEKGILDLDAEDDSYLNVEFIATARIKKNFLGFIYEKLDDITSFDDAAEIIKELDVDNVDTIYTNAVKGGKRQKRVTNLKLESSIGSKSDLKAFNELVGNNYISYAARIGDAKTSKRDSSYMLSREISKVYGYNLISKYYDRRGSHSVLLKPSLLAKQAKTVVKALNKRAITAINLTDIGYKLDSDFNAKGGSDRHSVRIMQEEYLAALSEKASVSIDYGSIFSAQYVDKIWNVPMSSSSFAIADASVPFYQIVLRGTVSYVAPSINQASDARTALLNAIEYGAEIRYTWIKNSADVSRLVDYTENYFDCLYFNSIEQAKSYSEEIKPVFEKIGQSKIIGHRSVTKTLKETKFESGYTVYVNYADVAAQVNGHTVEPQGFICVKTVA